MPLDLNNPNVRRDILTRRLAEGRSVVAMALADEFGISLDTVRRDLIALEHQGILRRVRGGGLPVERPLPPFAQRSADPDHGLDRLAQAAVALVEAGACLVIDGGTTMQALASRLPQGFDGLVVTPSPAVAVAAQARNVPVHMIGGRLSRHGGMAVGAAAERALADCAADLCFLGACGLHPSFGLGADDGDEASMKRCMAEAAAKVAVVASTSKLHRVARHRALGPAAFDDLVTDADREATEPYVGAGVTVHHV